MDQAASQAQLEDAIFTRIVASIHSVIPTTDNLELTLDTTFESLDATSLDIVTIAFELEDEYGIEIHNHNLDNFRSVRQARDTVAALIRDQR